MLLVQHRLCAEWLAVHGMWYMLTRIMYCIYARKGHIRHSLIYFYGSSLKWLEQYCIRFSARNVRTEDEKIFFVHSSVFSSFLSLSEYFESSFFRCCCLVELWLICRPLFLSSFLFHTVFIRRFITFHIPLREIPQRPCSKYFGDHK